jgi:protein phosphatase
MNRASFHIRDESRRNAEWAGMGTTLVACMIEEGMANLAHVGDSRIYLFRDGRLQRLTRDHTVVQQELDAGRLTPELARVVPHKNVLTQSIGFHGPVEPDSATRAVDDGDLFVLVSDGVSDPLSDDMLESICCDHGPADLAEVLVTSALEAGGEDNITCVVVHVLEA